MDEVLINYFFAERKSGKRKRFVDYLSQHPTNKATPISDDKIVKAKTPKTSNANNYLNTLLKSSNQNPIKQNTTFAKVCIADKKPCTVDCKTIYFSNIFENNRFSFNKFWLIKFRRRYLCKWTYKFIWYPFCWQNRKATETSNLFQLPEN